ncbi:MAG: metallophosphoesterase [Acutalibacteraceae bacterium]|nr:metallophosphoesterase [Acutalibacteraceae bacterium]
MKILMFSDFHISNIDFNIDEAIHIIDKAYEAVCVELDINEIIIILICGDIINMGSAESFDEAGQIFDHIRNKFADLDVKFRFVPGNHDICNGSLAHFDEFTRKYSDFHTNYSTVSAYSEQIENVNVIYASSVQNGNHDFGQLDYEEIKDTIMSKISHGH